MLQLLLSDKLFQEVDLLVHVLQLFTKIGVLSFQCLDLALIVLGLRLRTLSFGLILHDGFELACSLLLRLHSHQRAQDDGYFILKHLKKLFDPSLLNI